MSGLFDWPQIMVLGMQQLRLTPEVFWNLTPVELTIMAGGLPGQSSVVTRGRLQELQRQFPDD